MTAANERGRKTSIRLATTTADRDACEAVLRALPDWFGIPSAIDAYRRDLDDLTTWRIGDDPVRAFLAVRRHFPHAAELHVMGVRAEYHREGLGRRLVEHAEAALRADGVRVWQVKTLSPARENAAYARTRRFYEAMGFVAFEEFPTLWGEANPALQMVKVLSPTG